MVAERQLSPSWFHPNVEMLAWSYLVPVLTKFVMKTRTLTTFDNDN